VEQEEREDVSVPISALTVISLAEWSVVFYIGDHFHTPLVGRKELACGSQAFIATLLFDPSMSALPIIPKQNSVSVGLFTH
jgi:hypothetical protein